MEEKYVSVKPTTTIITLFERIVEMEGGVEGFDRQAIFNRVLLYTKDLTDNLVEGNKNVEKVEAEEVKLGDLRADEVSRLVRLNKYLNLLIHTDSVSIEKIKKIDGILKED